MKPYYTMMKPFFHLRGILLIATHVVTALSFQTNHCFCFSPAAWRSATTTTTTTQLPLSRSLFQWKLSRSRFSINVQLPLALAQEEEQVSAAAATTAKDDDEYDDGRTNNAGQKRQEQQGQQRRRRRYQPDSIKALEKDVQTVLKELQNFRYDPEVPDWFRLRQLSFSNYWGLEEWELHSSRKRFQRYIVSFPKSRLLRRLFPQLSVLAIWSIVAVLISQFRPGVFTTVQVPLTSLSLVSTFVAALQTLRSDKGLSRLSEGRLAMARMVLYTRDTAMLMSNYVSQQDERLGLKAARHLALFGWALKCHLRDTADDESLEILIRTLLGASYENNHEDVAYLLGERKKPVAILNRLRQIMSNMSQRKLITTTEHRLIEDNIRELDDVITVGERIRSTPIPPIYAGHSTRLMMLYLVFLPLALLGASMNGISTIAVTMVVGYAMLGLDEMSHMFEQPFRFMPLLQLARVSTLDVADAFCRPPPLLYPPLVASSNKEDEALVQQQQPLLDGEESSAPSSSSSSSSSQYVAIPNVNVNNITPSSSVAANGGSSSGSYRSSYWTNVEESDPPPLPYDGRNVKKHFFLAPS